MHNICRLECFHVSYLVNPLGPFLVRETQIPFQNDILINDVADSVLPRSALEGDSIVIGLGSTSFNNCNMYPSKESRGLNCNSLIVAKAFF